MLVVDPATAGAHRRYPSISLLLPIAGATPWQARLARLARRAESRLRAEFGAGVDHHLLERLADTVAATTVPATARSMAVYVNDATAVTVGVDAEVRERVVVDDTFATRDLVAADLRAARYWVLALTIDDPRLLRGHGDQLHPATLELRDTVEHPSTRDLRRGRDRSDIVDARRARRLRAVDQALITALAGDSDPLIVVAGEPMLSRFLERSRHIRRVEATVRRTPDRSLAALGEAVAPALAAVLAERQQRALTTLDAAVGAGIAASGIEPVWRSVHRATGLLVVEHSYEQPVRLLLGGGITMADDATEPGVVDDGVDDVIEAVLARGGRVELVSDGALAGHQRIAFVPHLQTRRAARKEEA